jgi:hypothetical protein
MLVGRIPNDIERLQWRKLKLVGVGRKGVNSATTKSSSSVVDQSLLEDENELGESVDA